MTTFVTTFFFSLFLLVKNNVVRNEFLHRIDRPVKERKHKERNTVRK